MTNLQRLSLMSVDHEVGEIYAAVNIFRITDPIVGL